VQEELSTSNLQKYRQLQHQLEDAQERADLAENSLAKIRSRGGRGGALGHTVRVATFIHSPRQASHGSLIRSVSVQRVSRSTAE
jgi:hypothetical protein